MDIVKINFCENSSYYIKNDRVRYDISKDIQTNYSIDIQNYIEKSYSDKLLGPITNPDTLVTFISIGNRYLLYLTKIYNEPVSILISIDQLENGLPKMYTCPMSFPLEYYDNTILYTEMVQDRRDTQRWYLLLERVLVYNSRINNKYGLDHVKLITSIFNRYCNNPLTPFKLVLKKYITVSQIETGIANVDYPIIGIRFYALRYPIVFYFNTNYYNRDSSEKLVLQDNFDKELESIEKDLYKLYVPKHIDKIGSRPKVDHNKEFILKCKRSGQYGIYNLYTILNYEDKLVGPARISSIEVQNKIAELCRENNVCYAICKYNYLFSKFEIVDSTEQYRLSSNSDIEEHIYNCSLLEVPEYYREE